MRRFSISFINDDGLTHAGAHQRIMSPCVTGSYDGVSVSSVENIAIACDCARIVIRLCVTLAVIPVQVCFEDDLRYDVVPLTYSFIHCLKVQGIQFTAAEILNYSFTYLFTCSFIYSCIRSLVSLGSIAMQRSQH